jgi:hypothetical protein
VALPQPPVLSFFPGLLLDLRVAFAWAHGWRTFHSMKMRMKNERYEQTHLIHVISDHSSSNV